MVGDVAHAGDKSKLKAGFFPPIKRGMVKILKALREKTH
jgi:hypothetical protein